MQNIHDRKSLTSSRSANLTVDNRVIQSIIINCKSLKKKTDSTNQMLTSLLWQKKKEETDFSHQNFKSLYFNT